MELKAGRRIWIAGEGRRFSPLRSRMGEDEDWLWVIDVSAASGDEGLYCARSCGDRRQLRPPAFLSGLDDRRRCGVTAGKPPTTRQRLHSPAGRERLRRMLETATWRTKNRKHFSLLEALYRQADRPLRTDGWNPDDDNEFAAGINHLVGSHLLSASINAGTEEGTEVLWPPCCESLGNQSPTRREFVLLGISDSRCRGDSFVGN